MPRQDLHLLDPGGHVEAGVGEAGWEKKHHTQAVQSTPAHPDFLPTVEKATTRLPTEESRLQMQTPTKFLTKLSSQNFFLSEFNDMVFTKKHS